MASYKFDKDEGGNLHIEKEASDTPQGSNWHLIIIEAGAVKRWYEELQGFMQNNFTMEEPVFMPDSQSDAN